MKKEKILFVLVPVLAFMLVACGGLFDGDEIVEELDIEVPQDEFIIEEEPREEPFYDEDVMVPDPMDEGAEGGMEVEEPEVIYEVE